MITEKIKILFFTIKNEVNNKMKPYDLTSTQIIILKYLSENVEKVVILKDLCGFLSLKHSTVIGILKRLEEKQLITRKTNYTSEIVITEKGKALVDSVGAKSGFIEDQLLKGFHKEEIEQLSMYLDRLQFNISNMNK